MTTISFDMSQLPTMAIVFSPGRISVLDKNSPKLYIAIQSGGLAAVNAAAAEIFIACRMNNGGVAIRSVNVSSSVLVESGANTFTQVTLDTEITDKFSADEVARGLVPVGMNVDFGFGAITASAASTPTISTVQLTKSSQTAILDIGNSDLLGRFRRMSGSGAAAGAINFITHVSYPAGRY